jgi:Zn-dependent protease
MPDTTSAVVLFVIFIYSVVLHEVAHGMTARALGDPTAERLGRLTLNPLKHLDMVGSFLLPLFLYFIRSPFIFGYAKPVPYDPRNLRDRRWGPAKVALAGPATNIALAALLGLAARAYGPALPEAAAALAFGAVFVNLVLAVFNLLPVPPLDGHWLLMAVLPPGHTALKLALYRYQWFLLLAVLFFVFPLLVPAIGSLATLLTGIH